MVDLLYKDEVYAIIGAAMEVYNELKPGFLEAVYQEALGIELTARGIPFISQPELNIQYKGRVLKKNYISDFLVFDQVHVEIKALDKISPREEAQLLNQIKAARMKLGLLINFGHPNKLEWKRIIF